MLFPFVDVFQQVSVKRCKCSRAKIFNLYNCFSNFSFVKYVECQNFWENSCSYVSNDLGEERVKYIWKELFLFKGKIIIRGISRIENGRRLITLWHVIETRILHKSS